MRQRALPRQETIWPPARGAARPGASVAFVERAEWSFAGRCARPAGVDERVAARPAALVNCGSSVSQPGEGRASVPGADLVFECGPRSAPQTCGSMELVESCAMRVTLLLRVSSLVSANELVIEPFLTHSGRRGSCCDAHPFIIIITRRKPALAVYCQ